MQFQEFDEWILEVFDENGDHSEPLYMFHGVWEGVQRVLEQDVTLMHDIGGICSSKQTRIVISRVM